jgi:hypothetical protein
MRRGLKSLEMLFYLFRKMVVSCDSCLFSQNSPSLLKKSPAELFEEKMAVIRKKDGRCSRAARSRSFMH